MKMIKKIQQNKSTLFSTNYNNNNQLFNKHKHYQTTLTPFDSLILFTKIKSKKSVKIKINILLEYKFQIKLKSKLTK